MLTKNIQYGIMAVMTGMVLAEKIRMLRERKGWNMSDLARVSGIPQPTIWRLEKGYILQPKTRILKLLAQALGVSTDYLLREEQSMPYNESLHHDPEAQAVFRDYDQLLPEARGQVRSFVGWLLEQQRKKGGEAQ
jgi:transcriptional regulator with XRE-family HTH domain